MFNSEWLKEAFPRIGPSGRKFATILVVWMPAMLAAGWFVRARQHDSLMNDVFIELKAKERYQQEKKQQQAQQHSHETENEENDEVLIPVAIPPKQREKLEKEREELITKIAAIQERRAQREFEERSAKLRRRMWEDGRQEPEHIERS
eukprot:gb/GECG01011139.1/.p1 GENE.gb/GECG01011139.1/~~gb/GECG01011139.1/.p1  ORF type:complete len:148 (+),score=33.93 gb/GECG01011139.1/:1-444(+)